MSLFSKIRGTMETIFQIGISGPQLKNDTNVIQARNAADNAFVNLEALDPITDQHVATKIYVDSASAQNAVRLIRFALGTGAAQNSVAVVPNTARIERCDVEITTGYDNNATIAVGRTGSTSLLQAVTDNNPASINTWSVPQDTAWGGTNNTVLVTIGNAPTVGVGVVRVWYSIPLV